MVDEIIKYINNLNDLDKVILTIIILLIIHCLYKWITIPYEISKIANELEEINKSLKDK